MASAPRVETIGSLLRYLQSLETCAEDWRRAGDREKSQLVAESFYSQSRAFETFIAVPETMPDIERIELLCDERFQSGITIKAIRGIRAEVCKKAKLTTVQADRLTFGKAADLLEGKTKKGTTPGPPGPTLKELAEMQAIERDWLAYRAHCRESRIRIKQGEEWQKWRIENGESDSQLTPEFVIQARKRFKEHLRTHPENAV